MRAIYVLVSQIFRTYSTILLVILIRMQNKNLEVAKNGDNREDNLELCPFLGSPGLGLEEQGHYLGKI